MIRLAYWLPPLAWMAVVMWFSSGEWSADETAGFFEPLLRWLLPGLGPAQVEALHFLARKVGHLAEYAILAALWFRALVHERPAPRPASWIALAVAVAWALLDEWHQSTIPTRTGSAADVVVDAVGAVAALTLARRGWRPAVEALTIGLLWLATVGGAAVLAVNALTGVASGALWLTVPAAALVLLVRRRRGGPPGGGAAGRRAGVRP